ncbi:MAG: FlgD immunoglobulin-like domain containing protein [Candidatus Eisenbacteria bacterium]
MHTPRIALVAVMMVMASVGMARAQDLHATYNGQIVQVELEGTYLQYTVQRADGPNAPFQTLEFNITGCTERCTYVDLEAELDAYYQYRIVVEMPEGGQRTFGPIDFKIDSKRGMDLSTKGAPNPMKGETTISWVVPATIAHRSEVPTRVMILDPAGREIRKLWESHEPLGIYEVEWDGMDSRGVPVPTGTYFYRVQVGPASEVGRLVVLRR